MKIGFVLFSKYHQKKDIGSSRIRGEYLIKYMKEAEKFKQGEKYDVVIFQKTYWKEYARSFKGLKILDICDTDYHQGVEIVNFIQDIDVITVPTQALKDDISQFTDKPVYIIKDRLDLQELPKPKIHTKKANKVVWFGYSQNIEPLEDAMVKIKKAGHKLIIVSDTHYNTSVCDVESIIWKYPECYKDIQMADFAVFPEYTGRMNYKSNNKDILSWGLGLPVAKNPNDYDRFIDPKERQKEINEKLELVKKEYDVKISVVELRKIIKKHINKNLKIL